MIRLASTVMLLRSGSSDPFEVLMLRRSASSEFAPDVFVFPGGAVDEQDYDERVLARVSGLDERRLARMFRARRAPQLDEAQEALLRRSADRNALLVTAFRELFEEAGVLLGADALDTINARKLHEAREKLSAGAVTFAELLSDFGVRLDAGELELFSQWITPPSEGRRFNAHFFIARADDQHAIADRFETHDEIWIAPQTALERFAAGTYAMVYPTIKHVERLAGFESIDALIAFTKEKPILRIMPNTTADDGFTLPNDLEKAW